MQHVARQEEERPAQNGWRKGKVRNQNFTGPTTLFRLISVFLGQEEMEGGEVGLLQSGGGRMVPQSSQDLQTLPVEFTEETFFCFRVKVPGMVPAGSSSGAKAPWSRAARELLEEHGLQPVLVEVRCLRSIIISL